jgi:hypothetical protein
MSEISNGKGYPATSFSQISGNITQSGIPGYITQPRVWLYKQSGVCLHHSVRCLATSLNEAFGYVKQSLFVFITQSGVWLATSLNPVFGNVKQSSVCPNHSVRCLATSLSQGTRLHHSARFGVFVFIT